MLNVFRRCYQVAGAFRCALIMLLSIILIVSPVLLSGCASNNVVSESHSYKKVNLSADACASLSSGNANDNTEQAVSITLVGDTVQEQFWNACKQAGLSDAAAAGVMGNAYAESGWNPGATDGTGLGDSIGYLQLTNDEKYAYLRWANNSLDTDKQVKWTFDPSSEGYFAKRWMTGLDKSGYYKGHAGVPTDISADDAGTFTSETDVEKATYSWMACYERCSNVYSNYERRLKAAKEYYEQYTGTSATAASEKSSEGCEDDNGSQKYGNSGVADGAKYHECQAYHYDGGSQGAESPRGRSYGCGAYSFAISINMLLGQVHKYCGTEILDSLGDTSGFSQDAWNSNVASWLQKEGLSGQISIAGSGDVNQGGVDKLKEYLGQGNTVCIFDMKGTLSRDNNGNLDGAQHPSGHYMMCYAYQNGTFLVSDPGRLSDHDACKYTEDQMAELLKSGSGINITLKRN